MTKINIKSNNIKFLGTREPLKVNRAGKGRSGKMIYELVSAVPSKYSIMRDDYFIYVYSNGRVLHTGFEHFVNVRYNW